MKGRHLKQCGSTFESGYNRNQSLQCTHQELAMMSCTQLEQSRLCSSDTKPRRSRSEASWIWSFRSVQCPINFSRIFGFTLRFGSSIKLWNKKNIYSEFLLIIMQQVYLLHGYKNFNQCFTSSFFENLFFNHSVRDKKFSFNSYQSVLYMYINKRINEHCLRKALHFNNFLYEGVCQLDVSL